MEKAPDNDGCGQPLGLGPRGLVRHQAREALIGVWRMGATGPQGRLTMSDRAFRARMACDFAESRPMRGSGHGGTVCESGRHWSSISPPWSQWALVLGLAVHGERTRGPLPRLALSKRSLCCETTWR